MTVETPRTSTGWEALALSEEQREFAGVVRRHLASKAPLTLARRAIDDPAVGAAVWDVLAGAGYPAVGLPEALGGIGDLLDVVVLLEESGAAVLPAPLTATAMAYQTALAADGQLPAELVSGERPMAFAVTTRSATLAGDEVLHLDAAALDGSSADTCLLVHRDGGEVIVAAVEVSGDGVARSRVDDVDPARPLVRLSAVAAPVAWARRVTLAPDRVLAPARVCLAADLVGVARAAHDAARAHVLERVQFGRPIGAFQAVKHRLADGYLAIERARSLVRAAAVAAQAEDLAEDAVRLSLMAKAAAAEAAERVTLDNVQLFGAIGVTFEADSHLFLRRARLQAPLLGRASALYEQLGRLTEREAGHA